MAAITQLTSNFLGGVSKQVDDKKLEGQVREVLNGYPDPTFGMLKRNGMRFNYTLKKATGMEFTASELENAAWFFIQQGESGVSAAYFGCIKGTDIHVWNSVLGTKCTVTNNGSAYLTGTKPEDYHFRSIQDTTIVTNKTIDTALKAGSSFTANTAGTVVLKAVEYGANYTVTLDGSSYTYKTRNSDDLADSNTDRLDAAEILAGIKGKIPGSYQVTQYKTSLEIRKSGNAFTLSCEGGISGKALDCFQDEVDDVSKLPPESTNGRVVKITNSSAAEDDYYLEYQNGEWKETTKPGVSTEFDENTMPHELVAISDTEFTFGPIDWKDREAGDDVTNPQPSFVGKKIQCTFFYNNRFGMLSEDNVIMSQANDPYNFWARSALTQLDSDPIDIQATSVKPTLLFAVLPCPQGLQVFARRQQFILVSGQDSVLTPKNVTIRGQANYEMDSNIEPVDMGTRDAFISKVPAYSRVMQMQQRSIEETPAVVDISKVVTEWLPGNISHIAASPQNSLLACGARNSTYVYIYRFYNDGEKDLFQSWVKWDMPGKMQAFSVMNDMFYGISQQADQYCVGTISINDVPLGVQTSPDVPSVPCLDMYTRPTVTYDEATRKTTFAVGYKHVEGKEPIMVWVPDTNGTELMEDIFALAGIYDYRPHNDAEKAPGYWTPIDVDGDNFSMRGDWTDYKDNIIVGYKFDYEVELPKFYYNLGRDVPVYDYTASLTISRAKFSIGKTGAVTFKLKAKGSDEWVDIQHVTDANYYEANESPVMEERQFTVPIHQRNMNFNLKVTSDLPYPVSLVSMMWEGNYSPRFYKRV